jgi:hypothetical protein
MKKLFEIVAERNQKQIELASLRKEFEAKEKSLSNEIQSLLKLENTAENGFDVIKIQLAESVLAIGGNPYGNTDGGGKKLAERAIIDIANNTQFMRKQYFGNKRYSGYYQESSHSYGMGPSHGSIVDEVGLKQDARKRDLTDEEKDASIYYLKNYTAIKEAKSSLEKVS